MFSLGYVWIFLITWLPSYLVDERGYSLKQMAVFGSLPYWGMAATSLAGGWASDYWIASGRSATFVRKTFAVAGLFLCAALILPAAMVANKSLAMGLLVGSCVSLGLFTSNVWAITQTLAGAAAAGKWTGFQNFIGNLGGVTFPNRSRADRAKNRVIPFRFRGRLRSSRVGSGGVFCCWC